MLPDAAVAESRRKIHEALVGSPAWVADTVREELARLEAAIEAKTVRQLADRLEASNPDRSFEFSEGVDWAVSELRALGAGQ